MTPPDTFGFAPLDDLPPAPRPARGPGPMGAAVRDAAADLEASTEATVEQRRRDAGDARAWREAEAAGLVLRALPLEAIATDALPRDRLALDAVAASEGMEELKASIRARGQREPIEVWPDGDGFQLKKGWRRLTALRQLHAETGEGRFATVTARVAPRVEDRLDRYVDMVEENVVREDLTFAEMARVAIEAAADAATGEDQPDAMVNRLYGSLHRAKRSNIRAFVFVLGVLGDALRWPKAVSRDLGLAVSRAINNVDAVEELKRDLAACGDADAQNRTLAAFVRAASAAPVRAPVRASVARLAFCTGRSAVTVRGTQCRIETDADLTTVPRARLARAVEAFEAALRAGPDIRSL